MRIADVWACVRVISDSIASLPAHLYRRAQDGERVRVTTGRSANLLNRPAPGMTQANLTGQIAAHLLLHGDTFIGKYRDVDGRVDQLGLLDPTTVTVDHVRGEPRYTITNGLGTSHHGTEDVLHIRALSKRRANRAACWWRAC